MVPIARVGACMSYGAHKYDYLTLETKVPRCATCRYCAEYAFEIGFGVCTHWDSRAGDLVRVHLTEDYCSRHEARP